MQARKFIEHIADAVVVDVVTVFVLLLLQRDGECAGEEGYLTHC